ncbi:hypothetical protein ZEAMMB73_Zm00001d016956 [Zea mays]|uniref:Uncharacterized protein n=1 Tax=Zea mays TaxID=4577 RepID=A0A1D6HBE8_MAIZE|nr:hypothetical protein ZEAMMB73_Zm00001d016956 [Zea mays]
MGVVRRLLLRYQWRLTAMEDLSIEAKEAAVRIPHPPCGGLPPSTHPPHPLSSPSIASSSYYRKYKEDMLMVSMMEGPRRTEKPTGVIFRKVCFYSWIKTHLASRVVVHRVLKADRKLWLAAVMHGEDRGIAPNKPLISKDHERT